MLKNDNLTCEECKLNCKKKVKNYHLFQYFVSATECNYAITDSEGTISSPMFPKEYPNNQNCSWNITSKYGHRIMMV